MKNLNKATMVVVIASLVSMISSCNKPKAEDVIAAKEPVTPPTEIMGRVGKITFPQFTVEETFVSDTVVHWKIQDPDGSIREANETISYKKIDNDIFFLSWIEQSGLTVSQVLHVKQGTVTTFVSRADEQSDRGQRSSMFLHGSFEFIQ